MAADTPNGTEMALIFVVGGLSIGLGQANESAKNFWKGLAEVELDAWSEALVYLWAVARARAQSGLEAKSRRG